MVAHVRCFTYISLLLKWTLARYYSPVKMRQLWFRVINVPKITSLASGRAESLIYLHHLLTTRTQSLCYPVPLETREETIGVRIKWGKEGGRWYGEGKGRTQEEWGEKGKLERCGTCHQVSQHIQLKWPLLHAKLFWAWGTNRKHFQEEFFSKLILGLIYRILV